MIKNVLFKSSSFVKKYIQYYQAFLVTIYVILKETNQFF
jgi:hypothetical protein